MYYKCVVIEAALCSPGQYLERGRCIPCPIGTFKSVDGNDPCEPCPPGINDSRQVTAAEGSTSQQDCTQVSSPYLTAIGTHTCILYTCSQVALI